LDSSFVDLDMLVTRIRYSNSKTYFLEAVKAYKAGALRAALSSAWVAVVYDLISKYRELDGMGDPAATVFIRAWDNATASGDVRKLLELESTIIADATANTQVINRIAETHLTRLREDRHLCAHPAFSTEAGLFEPSPELVRLHLVNAIDLVLSQEPLQGKAILEQFNIDVQSSGFPTAQHQVLDYVEQRYLVRVRRQNIRNFGAVLAKSLLKGIPPQWENQRRKIVASLVAVRDRAPASWPDVSDAITRLMNTLEPVNRTKAVTFLAAFPDFWRSLENATKTALLETVRNIDEAVFTDYRILTAVTQPDFRPSLLGLIDGLGTDQLRDAIAVEPLLDLWPKAVETYEYSPSFRGSEATFRDFISPFSGRLNSERHDALLDAVMENGQNWEAADTPTLLLAILKNSDVGNLPTKNGRDRFFQFLRRMARRDRYSDVLELFQTDGWVQPPPETNEDAG
jgi:hypothetical protein